MRDYVPGTVFIAAVPFDERRGAKRRPVVLVGSPAYRGRDESAVVCPITSAQHRPEDVGIDWRAANLPRPSLVRPRPRVLPKTDLDWRIGVLGEQDLAALKRALRKTLDL